MFFASKYVNLDVGSSSEEEVEGDIDIKDEDDRDNDQLNADEPPLPAPASYSPALADIPRLEPLPSSLPLFEPAEPAPYRGPDFAPAPPSIGYNPSPFLNSEQLNSLMMPPPPPFAPGGAAPAAPRLSASPPSVGGRISGFLSSIFGGSRRQEEEQQQQQQEQRVEFGERRAPRKMAKKPAFVRKVKVRKLDTNVLSLELGTALGADVPIATGDASVCKRCAAYLSAKSKTFDEEVDVGEPEVEIRKMWRCEFCGTSQQIFLEEEEMPKEESVDYLLNEEGSSSSSSSSVAEASAAAAAAAAEAKRDSMVVFCVDTSGSMCVTTEIDGKIKLKGFDRLERYRAVHADHGDQYMPSQRRDTTFVSRLQCVQAAVDSQLEELQRSSPNTKICLITFNHEVTVWGDGSQEPLIISGDKLSNYEQLVKEAQSYNTVKPIGESIEKLREKLFSLEDGGSTALGPALLVALTISSKFMGSRVIVCTDGRANVGLGNLDEDADIDVADAFYKRLAQDALAQGSIVSVVTIKGTDCKLEYLSPVASSTMGDIVIVDPFDLTNQFSNILAEPVIAAGVSITLLLHHGLFCRENLLKKKPKKAEEPLPPPSSVPMQDEDSSSSSSSSSSSAPEAEGEAREVINEVKKVLRDIGNVTKDSTTTFEYGIVKAFKRELFAKHQKGEEHLSSIPFQVQIKFKRISDGMKLVRVITKSMEIAFDRSVAEQEVQLDILAQHSDQISSALAMEGDYSRSRAYGYASSNVLRNFSKQSSSSAAAFSKWKSDIRDRNESIQMNQEMESASGLNLSDDEDSVDDLDEVEERRKKKSMFRREKRSDEVFSKVSSVQKKKFK